MSELVSVIIPTYNRTKLLMERALPSVLNQTHRNLDIHVVGDGTENATAEALHDLVLGGELRVHFTNIKHQQYPDDPGQAWCVLGLNARNFGLDTARAKYVTCLNDDDEWEPDMVERLLAVLENDVYGVRDDGSQVDITPDFVYGKSKYHWPDRHNQMAGSWPPGMGAFCDGAWLMKHDLGYRFDPDCIKRGLPEDGDLWERMYKGGVRMAFVDRLVHHYYPNPR